MVDEYLNQDNDSQKIVINTDDKSGEESPVKIIITLPTQAYFISGIRDFTLALTKNMTGFSEQWAYRFQSVVDELCNNAIEHGSIQGSEIRITFLSIKSKYLEIVVEDTGTGKFKKSAADMKKLLEERRNPGYLKTVGIRGRGLPQIVSSWTDEIRFEDGVAGGLRVIVRKYLDEHESDNLQTAFDEKNHLVLK